MPQVRRRVLGALAALLLTPAAQASTVIVPDQLPTIQAAIDLAPDTVIVRSGVYAERPVASLDIVVRGVGATSPETEGFHIFVHEQQEAIVLENLRFRRNVLLQTSDEVTELFAFRHCTFDSGWAQLFSDVHDVQKLEFTDCRISGPFAPYAEYFYVFERNVADVPVLLNGGPLHSVVVRDNRVESPTPTPSSGIFVSGDETVALLERNEVRGFGGGIHIQGGEHVRVVDNRVEDCTGRGIDLRSNEGTAVGNVVLRCGSGIRIFAGWMLSAERNVVGRCAGDGLGVELIEGQARVTRNTLYLNGGSGVAVAQNDPGVPILVDHNIGFGNGRYGAEAVASPMSLSCNDWFGNVLGAASPGPGATDLAVDPMFCDVAQDDVRLHAQSPVRDAPGCGLVGARGVGCNVSTGVEDAGAVTRFELAPIRPNPARHEARLAFRLPRAAAVALDVLDLQGRAFARLVAGTHAAGEHAVTWRAPEPGIYFVRFRHPTGVETRRLAIVR